VKLARLLPDRADLLRHEPAQPFEVVDAASRCIVVQPQLVILGGGPNPFKRHRVFVKDHRLTRIIFVPNSLATDLPERLVVAVERQIDVFVPTDAGQPMKAIWHPVAKPVVGQRDAASGSSVGENRVQRISRQAGFISHLAKPRQ